MADRRRDDHRDTVHPEWPRESEPGEGRGRPARVAGGAWPLLVVTVVVLAGGYGWLGSVAGGALGALVGSGAGLVTGALLYLLVDSAVLGRPIRHRRTRKALRRPAR